jgi:hypothetical protein
VIERAQEADRASRDAEYLAMAEWLASRPFNTNDEDKTWVLHFMRRLERLFAAARPLPGKGPDGSLR